MRTAPLGTLLATEAKHHRRYGVLAGLAATTALWALVLLALPADWRGPTLPWLLFLEVTAVGFFVMPALAVIERGNGVAAALRLTRLSPGLALATRVGLLTALTLPVALVVMLAAGVGWSTPEVVGVLLTTTLFSLLAVVVVGRSSTLTPYLSRTPAVAVPLLLPALADGIGLLESPLLHLSPATGGLQLLSGGASPGAVVWMIVWIAVLSTLAVRIGFDVTPADTRGPTPSFARRSRIPIQGSGPWAAVASLARVDRRTLLTDGLMLLLVAGIALIAVALRWFGGPGLAWVDARHDVDLTPHLPAIWAFVLMIHVPVMLGTVTGLLFLEDRDAELFPALAVTPAGLRTVLTYRLGATALAASIAVAVGSALAAVPHEAGAAGVVAIAIAGGAVAVVPAVLLAALAQDRVQGMALAKVLTVPLYLPVAWWFVDGPAGWVFAVTPTGLASQTLWADGAGLAAAAAIACVLTSASITALGARRLLR